MTIKLPVTLRDKTESLNKLRANGNLPAVIYGPKQSALSIQVDAKVFDKVLKEAGEATIIELSGMTNPIEVLIKEVDFDPVKQQFRHIDFYAIEKGKEITANVPLHFVGVAPVEESGEGSVTKVLHEVEVTCKPKYLPSHIDVDLSKLVTVTDKITVADLALPIEVATDLEPDESVVVISPARTHAEEDEEESAEISATPEDSEAEQDK
jgi:large subunit ribosomal protein L25